MSSQSLDNLASILKNTNSHLTNITHYIQQLSSDNWVMYGAIIGLFANFILAIVAIYAANKDYFNGWRMKPQININGPAFTLRQDWSATRGLIISRLTINNSKKVGCYWCNFYSRDITAVPTLIFDSALTS